MKMFIKISKTFNPQISKTMILKQINLILNTDYYVGTYNILINYFK